MQKYFVKNCPGIYDKRCMFCDKKYVFINDGKKDIVFIHDRIISSNIIGSVTNKLTHIVHPSRISHIYMLNSHKDKSSDIFYINCANKTLLKKLESVQPRLVLACGENILSFLQPNKAPVKETDMLLWEREELKFHYMKFSKFEYILNEKISAKNLMLNSEFIRNEFILFCAVSILQNETGIDFSESYKK